MRCLWACSIIFRFQNASPEYVKSFYLVHRKLIKMSNTLPFETTSEQQKWLRSIMNDMIASGLDPLFCLEVGGLAYADQGIFDLMLLWAENTDSDERGNIIEDIKNGICLWADALTKGQCHYCRKPVDKGHNYCSWTCQVNEAKAGGGKVITPNGLPIACIRHDGTMLEHEHGDHPDYIFPIDVEYTGDKADKTEDIPGLGVIDNSKECHALIYADSAMALTLYECTYSLWNVNDTSRDFGKLLYSSYLSKSWKITDKSLEKIRTYLDKKGKSTNG